MSFSRTLDAHRGALVPFNLGGNDVQALSDVCQRSFACAQARAPREMAQLSSRLASILRRLGAADPKAEIIVIGLWNNDITTTRQSDPLYHAVDLAIGRVAKSVRAHFADPFPLFNPQGSLAREKACLCTYTFICSRRDGHPTDAGYRAIAAAVFKASGYPHRS